MENKREKNLKNRSSPQSNNNSTSGLKILKSTSNLSSTTEGLLMNSSSVLINSKSPQVSYRVVNLNPTNSIMPSSPTASSSSQYVLMMPNNNNQNPFCKKDQKRKMMHKEIERRRRDKINDWIYALSKEVPDCAEDRTKQGQSKGGILAKTVKYIQELRAENVAINKEVEGLRSELERARKRLTQVEEENGQLYMQIKIHSQKT